MTVAIFVTAAPASASAAGVAFIATDAVSIAKPTARATRVVELLNGSGAGQRLSLRVLGGARSFVSVTPNRGTTGPGATKSFTITVKSSSVPITQVGTLLAISTDGTSTRLPLRLGPAVVPPTTTIPKTLDVGVKRTNTTASVMVAGLSGAPEGTSVGSLYGAGGQHVGVSVKPGTLVVEGAKQPGAYSGDIDVNGSAAGGKSTVTMRARRGLLWAFLPLLIGIGLGFAIEWWLTRWRPRGLLDRRLGRLIQRTEARRWRVDQTLAEHFDCSQGSTPGRCKRWRLPQAALPRKAVGADEATSDVDRYYFTRAGSQLSKGLNEARTDPERELFGPDGDKFKALLAGETVYAELVGELREAVYVVDRVFAELKDTNGIPMRDRFDYELRGWIVGDELQLAARRDSAKALRVAAEHFAELHRRIHQAIRLNNARTSPDPALATKLASRHAELVHTFHGDDDQMLWWNTEMPALESAVYVPPAPTTVAPAAAPEVPGTAIAPPPADEPLANACCRKFDHEDGTAPVENPVGIPPWEATRRALRGRAFTTAEALVGAASLLTILASGMGAIYLTNDTFGSTANVVSAFLWGSTATTAVALLRRLLPGGLTTLKGS